MGGQINVAVDASPSPDLNQIMTEIRDHYEAMIAKNRRELETWYQNKVKNMAYHSFKKKLINTSNCVCNVPRSQQ